MEVGKIHETRRKEDHWSTWNGMVNEADYHCTVAANLLGDENNIGTNFGGS